MSTPDLFNPPADGPSHILEDLAGLNSPAETRRYLVARGRHQEAQRRALAHRRMLESMHHPRDRHPSAGDRKSQRRNPLYSRAMDATRVNDGAIGKTQQGIPANAPISNILGASPYFGSGGSTP